jgi:adenine-specific DNA-methyltransferase
VESGGCAGTTIDFRATGAVKLPSGEPAPAGGFMTWEIPREPGTPWLEDHQCLWAKAHAVSKDASRKKQIEAEHALAELNHPRGAKFTFETLPAQPLTPWPKEAEAALSRFWEARIARQKDIDASIAARADIEYLKDKPYIDNARIRVAGPFTVESLSLRRMLAVDHDDELIDTLEASSGGRAAPKRSSDETGFATLILENLKTFGVQQAHKENRITFTALTGWPGDLICAEGRFMESDKERRAGIFIEPEFDTVARADLVAAARGGGGSIG